MFKTGDVVVCIDNAGVSDLLKLYHKYRIEDSIGDKSPIVEISEIRTVFQGYRFILLVQYRKLKIEKCLKRVMQ